MELILKKAPYFSKVLSVSAENIFRGTNILNNQHNDESYAFI